MMYKNTSKMMLKIVNFWLKKFFSLRSACEKKNCGVPCGHSFGGLRPYSMSLRDWSVNSIFALWKRITRQFAAWTL